MTTASDAEALLLRNQNYQAAREWALHSMSDEDLSTYNHLVSEPATRDAGVDFLYSRWLENRPSEAPTPPAPPAQRDPDLYYSQADVAAAMRDPRYQTDSRYRDEVTYRVYQSKQAGHLESSGRFYSQGSTTTAGLGDRDAAWHEQHKRQTESDRAAEHAARLERQAESARAEAEQAVGRQAWTQWS